MKLKRLRAAPKRIVFGLVALSLTLGACAQARRTFDLTPEPVDPESPIAAKVVAVSRASPPFAGFDRIPHAPQNPPSAALLKDQVIDLVQQRRALAVEVAGLTPPQTDMDGFIARNRMPIEKLNLQPADPSVAKLMEADAEVLRRAMDAGIAKATPPGEGPSLHPTPATQPPLSQSQPPQSQLLQAPRP